jgi:hypothetical protein
VEERVTRSLPGLQGARAGLALAAALCAFACATPPSDEEVEAQLRAIAAEVKPRGELRVVSIHAESRMDAWTKLAEEKAEGKAGGASQPARRLARAFEKSHRLRVAVVTGGPYADLNEQMVQEAFALAKEKHPRMAGLTLVFVSPEPPSPELRAVVRIAGALLVHRAPPLSR